MDDSRDTTRAPSGPSSPENAIRTIDFAGQAAKLARAAPPRRRPTDPTVSGGPMNQGIASIWHPIDIAILVLYFVAMIGIGVAVMKKASKGLDSYFLAGNTLPW